MVLVHIVGMKRTLVYHLGGVMHEYRLIDEALLNAGILQIFSAGDPLHEAPHLQNVAYADENNYLNESTHSFNEAQEVVPSHEAPLPSNIVYGDENHYVEECTNFVVDEQELLVGVDENIHVQEQPDDSALFNLPVQNDREAKPVKHEYIGEPSYTSESCNAENPPVDADYFLDKSFLDATDDPLFGDGTFIETNDLKQPELVDTSSFDMLDEYLQYFDATDCNLQLLGFDYPNMMESDDLPSDTKASHISEDVIDGINDNPSSSKQETTEFASDFQYPFSKHASRMLGSIPTPPAFASDFSKKDAALRMNSASPSTIHITAGVIRIRNLTLSGSRMDLSFGKNGLVNVGLSFGLSRGNDYFAESQPSSTTFSDKSDSAISLGWFCFMFMWVLFLTMSFKIGSFICAN